MDSLRLALLLLGVLVLVGIYGWDRLRSARRRESDATRRGGPSHPEPDAEAAAQELADLEALIAGDRAAGDRAAGVRADGPGDAAHARVDAPAPGVTAVEPSDPAPASAPASPNPNPSPEAEPRRAAGPARRGAPPPRVEAPTKLVVIQIAAPAGGRFQGADLARVFRSEGLEFGAMRIYHRNVPEARDAALFSVANLVEPGYFDPESMEAFSTPGLVLLQQLPGPRPGPEAFKEMLATAQRLADRLDGELRDERRNPLTRQRMEALRAEVTEHERLRHLSGTRA